MSPGKKMEPKLLKSHRKTNKEIIDHLTSDLQIIHDVIETARIQTTN